VTSTNFLGREAKSRAGYGTFCDGIILIDPITADPDRAKEAVWWVALIDRLASGEGDDPSVSCACVVIANRSGQRAKWIRITDAEQRRHSGIRPDIMWSFLAGAIRPSEEPDRPAVQRLFVAAEGHRGERLGDRDFQCCPATRRTSVTRRALLLYLWP
jgi:hypothetical protein